MSDNLSIHEERSSVRASDRILFSFRSVTPEFHQRLLADYRRGISLYRQDGIVELQMFAGAQGAFDRLGERDEDMAAVLRMLDRKLNFILQKTAGKGSPLERMAIKEVNLSGSGLAFFTHEAIAAGTVLEFYIILLPDYNFVYALGEVVKSEAVSGHDGGAFRIAASFVLIHEEDSERLIQHNFKQQSLALRNRRLKP